MRLNKYIAKTGITSRRKADLLIQDGLIQINGKVVNPQGTPLESATIYVEKPSDSTFPVYMIVPKNISREPVLLN